ncbi:MAG: InlB B-repeat-containing protein, partial [Clostridiales bacterium]|nr:InlB B-repeat-containing protein [Candidatus Coliplasma equi]
DYLFLGTSDAGKVRFVTDEKTVPAVEKAVGEKIDVPAAAYKNGYVFKGWFNDKGEELKDAITVKAGVETYTAKFEEKSTENTNKQYFNEEVRLSNLPVGKLLLIIGSVLLVLLATVVLIIKTKKSKVKEK